MFNFSSTVDLHIVCKPHVYFRLELIAREKTFKLIFILKCTYLPKGLQIVSLFSPSLLASKESFGHTFCLIYKKQGFWIMIHGSKIWFSYHSEISKRVWQICLSYLNVVIVCNCRCFAKTHRLRTPVLEPEESHLKCFIGCFSSFYVCSYLYINLWYDVQHLHSFAFDKLGVRIGDTFEQDFHLRVRTILLLILIGLITVNLGHCN